MPTSPIVQALIAATVLICLLAFWKGNAAERFAAGFVLANIVWGVFLAGFLSEFAGLTRLINDAVLAIAMLALLLRFGAPWLGVAMLLYAAQFTLHSYYLVVGRADNDQFHAVANNLIFLGISVSLLLGTILAWRRRVRARTAS